MRRLLVSAALVIAIILSAVYANAAVIYGGHKFGAFGSKAPSGAGGGGFTPPTGTCLLVDVGNCLLVDTGNKLLVQ